MSGLGLASAPSGGATGAGSAAGGGSGPNPISTQHPSILPLRLEGGDVVVAAAAAPAADSVLLSGLAASLAPNPRDSPPNALVFGVASQGGPVSQLDAVVGSVRGWKAGRGRGAGAGCVGFSHCVQGGRAWP
jgi:hypothetical protein